MKTFFSVQLAQVKRLVALAGVVMLLGIAGEARGQTTNWTGNATSDWNDPGSWDNGIPYDNYTVYIDTNGTVQPILDDETGTTENLYVGETGGMGGSGTNTLVTVQGAGLLYVGGTFIVGDQFGATGAVTTTDLSTELYLTNGGIVGNSSVGLLTVANSATVDGGNEELDLGEYAGSSGTVVVNGGTLGNVSTLVVGVSGAGNLTVNNEGNVTATSVVVSEQALGSGNVSVDGTGSNLYAGTLGLGFFGNGTMTVDQGGAGTTTSYLYLGPNTNTTGTLTVNGTGSTFTAGGVAYIGGTGTGNLAITNGGVFNGSAGISVGDQNGGVGNVTVDGSGSKLLLGGAESYVGNYGRGTLTVTNGGVVDGGGESIGVGEYDNGNGTLLVDGGTVGNVSNIIVGDDALGTATLQDGANVTLSNGFDVGGFGPGTVTVDGAGTVLNAPNLYVGEYANATMTVDHGATVTTSGVYVGAFSTSHPAYLTVNGTGTTFDSGPSSYIGYSGNGTVTVQNGAVFNANRSGLYMAGSSNALANFTVDGSGSQLRLGQEFVVGYLGSAALNVTNGGVVDLGGNEVDLGQLATANGTATVDGTGSVLGNMSLLVVGDAGSGNLAVTNGGVVNTAAAYVTNQNGALGSVTVDGSGSVFNATAQLQVGYAGAGSMTVSNGATLNAGTMAIGGTTGGNGTAVVTGADTQANETGGLTVGDGGNGSLTVNETAVFDNQAQNVMVAGTAGLNGTVVVDDASFGNIGFLDVGQAGNGNLTVQDGGNMSAASVTVGDQATGNGAVLATGAGTIFNSTSVIVGDSGNGALAVNASAIWDNGGGPVDVGDAVGSNGAMVVNGGTLQNVGTFDVGCCGNGTLAILAGGNVVASSMDVGVQSMGENASVAVSGAGSTLYLTVGSGSTGLTVGDGATGAMLVSSGGLVDLGGADLMVGAQSGYYGNLTVDAGTVQNVGTLTVGESGTGNVTVDDGATVTASTLVAGDQSGSLGNIDITGPNSTVTMSGSGTATLIGNSGSANMSVTDFAILDNGGQDAQIGVGTTGSGNVAVTSGAQWKNVGDLSVGYDGTGTLTVTSSGSVAANDIFVGSNSTSASGLVTVGGANTTVSVADYIEVGDNGPGEFDIRNGANVTAGYVTVANNVGGPGNMTVDGTNSTLSVTSTLEVGDSDMGNMTISGGANVTAESETEIGGTATGIGNLDVTGDNSVLTTGELFVGTFGTGTLTVENGGVVTVTPGNGIAFTLGGGTGTVNVGSAGTLQVGGADGIDPGSGVSTFNLLGGTVQVIGSDFSTAINATLATSTTSIIDTNGFNATWAGNIAGGGKLSKNGVGTLTLSGVDTYTGLTTVNVGRLEVTGSLASVVSVSSGATLGGNGSVSNSVTLATGARIAPGFGGPSLTLGNLTWGGSTNGTATAYFTLSGVDNTASLLTILGNFTKGAGTTFEFDFGGTGHGTTTSPVTYTLISFGSLFDAGNGTFNISDFSYENLGSAVDSSGTFAYSGNNLTFEVVPEPGLAAVVVGLAGLAAAMVRRRGRS